MKAAFLTGIRQLQILDTLEPRLKNPQDVLLRIDTVGVCGSDVHYYTMGRIGNQVVKFPERVGHECAGTVVEMGGEATGLRVGQRVAIDPLLACGCKSVPVSTANKNRAGSEAQSFDNVTAATNSAINQDFRPSIDGGNDFWQCLNARGDPVQLPAAMIRDHNRSRTVVNSTTRIISSENAFDHNGARPQLVNPAEIAPGYGCRGEAGGDVYQRHRPLAGNHHVLQSR